MSRGMFKQNNSVRTSGHRRTVFLCVRVRVKSGSGNYTICAAQAPRLRPICEHKSDPASADSCRLLWTPLLRNPDHVGGFCLGLDLSAGVDVNLTFNLSEQQGQIGETISKISRLDSCDLPLHRPDGGVLTANTSFTLFSPPFSVCLSKLHFAGSRWLKN